MLFRFSNRHRARHPAQYVGQKPGIPRPHRARLVVEHTDKAVSEFGKRRRALGDIGAPPRPGGRHLDIGEINHIARPELRLRNVERSEEHTSELQSLMRISYAVFCLKKKKK